MATKRKSNNPSGRPKKNESEKAVKNLNIRMRPDVAAKLEQVKASGQEVTEWVSAAIMNAEL